MANRICEASGKQCYRSQSHAKNVMRRLSRSLRAYPCRDCGAWHLSKVGR